MKITDEMVEAAAKADADFDGRPWGCLGRVERDRRMNRYLVVVHNWFIDSEGFEAHEIEAADDDAAQDKAYALAARARSSFSSAAAHVVKIGEKRVLKPRKLTWRERLTGRLAEGFDHA